jgi:hypothetical protein
MSTLAHGGIGLGNRLHRRQRVEAVRLSPFVTGLSVILAEVAVHEPHTAHSALTLCDLLRDDQRRLTLSSSSDVLALRDVVDGGCETGSGRQCSGQFSRRSRPLRDLITTTRCSVVSAACLPRSAVSPPSTRWTMDRCDSLRGCPLHPCAS